MSAVGPTARVYPTTAEGSFWIMCCLTDKREVLINDADTVICIFSKLCNNDESAKPCFTFSFRGQII